MQKYVKKKKSTVHVGRQAGGLYSTMVVGEHSFLLLCHDDRFRWLVVASSRPVDEQLELFQHHENNNGLQRNAVAQAQGWVSSDQLAARVRARGVYCNLRWEKDASTLVSSRGRESPAPLCAGRS